MKIISILNLLLVNRKTLNKLIVKITFNFFSDDSHVPDEAEMEEEEDEEDYPEPLQAPVVVKKEIDFDEMSDRSDDEDNDSGSNFSDEDEILANRKNRKRKRGRLPPEKKESVVVKIEKKELLDDNDDEEEEEESTLRNDVRQLDFNCDLCSAVFGSNVALKVHKTRWRTNKEIFLEFLEAIGCIAIIFM